MLLQLALGFAMLNAVETTWGFNGFSNHQQHQPAYKTFGTNVNQGHSAGYVKKPIWGSHNDQPQKYWNSKSGSDDGSSDKSSKGSKIDKSKFNLFKWPHRSGSDSSEKSRTSQEKSKSGHGNLWGNHNSGTQHGNGLLQHWKDKLSNKTPIWHKSLKSGSDDRSHEKSSKGSKSHKSSKGYKSHKSSKGSKSHKSDNHLFKWPHRSGSDSSEKSRTSQKKSQSGHGNLWGNHNSGAQHGNGLLQHWTDKLSNRTSILQNWRDKLANKTTGWQWGLNKYGRNTTHNKTESTNEISKESENKSHRMGESSADTETSTGKVKSKESSKHSPVSKTSKTSKTKTSSQDKSKFDKSENTNSKSSKSRKSDNGSSSRKSMSKKSDTSKKEKPEKSSDDKTSLDTEKSMKKSKESPKSEKTSKVSEVEKPPTATPPQKNETQPPFPPKEKSKSTKETGSAEKSRASKRKTGKGSAETKEQLPRFGPTMKPPYKKPKVCSKATPSCCVGGELTVNLNNAKGKKSTIGKLDGLSVIQIQKGQGRDKKQPCSSNALIMVDFEKIDPTGCFGCLEAPYCGKRMLKMELQLSNAKRNGWLFNVGDSETNNGYRGDSGDQVNDAEAQALFPNITVYPSDRCPTINSLMHIVNAVANNVNTITVYISNEHIKITNSDGLDFKMCHKCLYALNGQPDSGPGGAKERICIGVNRVVKDLSRTGYGVCSAKFSWECPWCM